MANSPWRFFNRTLSDAAGFGIGGALRSPLEPSLQELTNVTWELHPNRPLQVEILAEGVAQGQVDYKWAVSEAGKNGVNAERFDRLIAIFDTGPGVAQAFQLWRRKAIDQAGFRRVLKRQGLEDEWINALWDVRQEVLDPADLARGIHRGLVPDPGLLKGELPSGVGNVPAYPVYPIDALKEAHAAGFDRDHLGVLVGLQGNPMGAHEAAQAEFRGVLTRDDFLRAIAEGNTRNEWADAIHEQSRAIPTVTNYVEARVRGWIDDAEMYAGAARHGMTPQDVDLEFKIHGRPLSFRQTFIGTRRGGKYNGATTGVDQAFLDSLKQSNVRPEWYNLAWAQRYTYPAAFVLRALTTDGDLTQAESEQILLYEGWEPTLATKVSTKWATPKTGTTQDPWIGKAETQLWTATHKAYVKGGITKPQAETAITHFIEQAATRAAVFVLWDAERTVLTTPPPPAPVVP